MKEIISGAKNIRTFLTSFIIVLAGLAFFLIGFSSFFKKNHIVLISLKEINFLPQGFIMLFYGSLALGIGFYLFLTIIWNIGSGYNEFSKKENLVRILRFGFPGKYRKIYLSFNLSFIEKLKVSIKNDLNPRCNILLILKDKREIPLYPSQKLLTPLEIEKKAVYLSTFLELPLESNLN